MTTAAPLQPVAAELLPQLRRARDHIDRNFSQELTLSQLAAVARLSKFHFARSLSHRPRPAVPVRPDAPVMLMSQPAAPG